MILPVGRVWNTSDQWSVISGQYSATKFVRTEYWLLDHRLLISGSRIQHTAAAAMVASMTAGEQGGVGVCAQAGSCEDAPVVGACSHDVVTRRWSQLWRMRGVCVKSRF